LCGSITPPRRFSLLIEPRFYIEFPFNTSCHDKKRIVLLIEAYTTPGLSEAAAPAS
jgi:hypothetical protein